MKKLILIGASGVAHEIIDTVLEINRSRTVWAGIGVLDDDLEKKGKRFYRDVRVLGTSREISHLDLNDHEFLVTFSSPENYLKRESYIENLSTSHPAIQFAKVVHPTAYLSPSAEVGVGVFLAPQVIVDSCARIGDHVIVLFHSVISRFVKVGRCSFISATVNIVGGKEVGRNVYLGVRSTLNADVGDYSLVGASSLVGERVPPLTLFSSSNHRKVLQFKSTEKLATALGGLSQCKRAQ